MNKDRRELIPELRFPEFVNDGNWMIKELGEITEIVRGGSPRPIQDYLTNDANGLGWLKIADVSSDSKFITNTKEKIIAEGLQNSREVNPGDLILSNSMSFGRPYILKITTCIHDGWIAIRKISDITFEDYLYYFISSDFSQKYFNIKAAGAAVKNLNAEIIKLLPIYLPDAKDEQQKIASCLSSLDELITAQKEKLELLKKHKKGLMQNLFPQEGETVPKFRFPEFENDGDWDEKTLDELFTIGNGRDYKHLGKGNIPVYGSGGYMLSVNSCLYDGESVCIGRKGTIDKPMFLDGKFWTVDTLFYTHSFIDCIPKFIFFIFQNINWRKHNEAGGVPSLSKTNINKIKTLVPELKEQKQITRCLSSLDDLISIQKDKLKELQLHKIGLMQGLFPKMID